jgi:hypothetical protein
LMRGAEAVELRSTDRRWLRPYMDQAL